MKIVPRERRSLAVLIVGSFLLFPGCQTRTPALDLILDSYPGLGSGIYEELGRWKAVLGEPETVAQADGGTTFFYWPQLGVAVFTHPLYEGQFQHKGQAERKVTSVILPLRESFHPGFLPVEDDVVVDFSALLDLRHLVPESLPSRQGNGRSDTLHVDVVSSPFRKTVERLHVLDGDPIAIEVRDSWWLSHYD